MRENADQKNADSLRSEKFSANLWGEKCGEVLFQSRMQIVGRGVFLGILGNIFL